MSLKSFKKVDIKDRILMQFQDNVSTFFNQLNKTFLGGVLLTKTTDSNGSLVNITIGTSTTLVPHGLARSYQGWVVTDRQADARVWRDTSSTADPELFLPLKASASVTVKLWVF